MNIWHFSGGDFEMTEAGGRLTIRCTGRGLWLRNSVLMVFLLPGLAMFGLLLTTIVISTRTLFEGPAISILFLIMFIPASVLVAKVLSWLQSLLFGFDLSLDGDSLKGRWGILPVRKKIGSDSRIILTLAYMRGNWGCRGFLKSSRHDFFPASLFIPYAMFSRKKKAKQELQKLTAVIRSHYPNLFAA